MLSAFAQATTFQTNTTTTTVDDGMVAGIMAALMGAMLIVIPVLIFTIVCLYKIFEKAGVEGWKAIIPIYNGYVLAEIAGKPGWWALVGLAGVIPILGFIATIAAFVLYVIISIELSKAFGKQPAFALLILLLSPVGLGILAFGDAAYRKPVGTGGTPVAPQV